MAPLQFKKIVENSMNLLSKYYVFISNDKSSRMCEHFDN